MRLCNRHGEAIRSLADWSRLGSPASEKHWKPGRSAYELAADWTQGDAETDLVALLASRSEFAGLELLEGVVEKQTYFDDQSRGPRNHDLLVRGRLPSGCVTIGIEGKTDEPFDDPLWLYREKALKRSHETGALRRVGRPGQPVVRHFARR